MIFTDHLILYSIYVNSSPIHSWTYPYLFLLYGLFFSNHSYLIHLHWHSFLMVKMLVVSWGTFCPVSHKHIQNSVLLQEFSHYSVQAKISNLETNFQYCCPYPFLFFFFPPVQRGGNYLFIFKWILILSAKKL